MSDVVPAANKGTIAVPRDDGTGAFRAARARLVPLANSSFIEEVELGIKEVLPAIQSEIGAANRTATDSELGRELMALVAAFPNSKADASFSAILISYVAEKRPSIGALTLMRRHFILNSKFMPSVSEVLEVLEKTMRNVAACKDAVDGGLARRLELMKKDEADRLERSRKWREENQT